MSFNPYVVLVALSLNNPADLVGVIFVAVLHMVLQPFDQELFMLLGCDWFDLLEFLDTYLKLCKDKFEGPLGRVWKFESSTNSCKALLLDLVISAGGPLDDVALNPVKKVLSIYLDLDFGAERNRAYSLLAAGVFTAQLQLPVLFVPVVDLLHNVQLNG